MERKKIDRINALARKAKSPEGLTDQEKAEQAQLRREYIDGYKQSLRTHLESIVIDDGQGNRRQVSKEKPN